MLFAKPKTIQNFELSNELGVHAIVNKWGIEEDENNNENEDDIDNSNRRQKIWSNSWVGIIQDPLFFWYLMVIFENFKNESLKQEMDLIKFNQLGKYSEVIEKYDTAFYNDSESSEQEIYKGCPQSMTLLRILCMSSAFYAFDIRNISLNDSVNEILQKILQETIVQFRQWMPSSDDLENLSFEIEELCSLKDDRNWKGWHKGDQAQSDGIVLLWDDNFCNFYPSEEEKNPIYNIWDSISMFGKHTKIRLEFDKENMQKLEWLIINTVSEFVIHHTALTHKFIGVAKKCEKIGNTLYIPFEKIATRDFPLLQYLYNLQLNDGCELDSWLVDDDWIVTIFDETIADALGMVRADKQDEKQYKTILFDYEKEVLFIDSKKKSLGETNDAFIRFFFKLEKDGEIAIDELSEAIDTAIVDMDRAKRRRAEKSMIYDRVPQINRTLNKLTGVEKFFSIENRKVILTNPDILEQYSKTARN